jgi:AAA+ superfamily predicted ATPase
VVDEGAPHSAAGIREGLRLIEELIRLEVARLRASGVPVGQDEYRGLYLSDEQIDQMLVVGPQADLAAINAEFDRARDRLKSLTIHATDRLGLLARSAGLNPFEVGCLLLCLALEADLRFERLFAYVQDDVTKRRPRVDLAVRLLSDPLIDARASFAADAPLRRYHLISLRSESNQTSAPLLAQAIVLDARIAGHLLGSNAIDEALLPHAELITPPPQPLALPQALSDQLTALAALPPTALPDPIIQLTGRVTLEQQQIALALARASGLNLLAVNLPTLVSNMNLDTALTLAQREAALQPAALYLPSLNLLKPDQADQCRAALSRMRFAPLIFLGADGGPFNWPGMTIHLPDPDYEQRVRLWAYYLGEEARVIDPALLETLAGKFKLSAQQIAQAVRAARGQARWREPAQPKVSIDDLYAAARSQSTPILNNLAKKITPHYTWEDIVLPDDTRQHLREMCNYVEHRHIVYDKWGFERKLALGKGLMALFAGESGTGKTMAADILAGALGLELYKIDLSAVVSKYIGETEKNLNAIFQEAQTSNAILFFDEADALFGKRSEVKDAHDRYANIETAYLLQKMEEYEGVVILATNLKMNLDEAFMRRMHFVVDFPLPEEDDRRRIWQAMLPAELPLADDVDLDFMARKFKIAGANIRNIALSAAFLAAADGQVVKMNHLIQATRREFQKIGRLITATDFDKYYDVVKWQ